MSADTSFALQQAVYTALTGDATLMALISGVFDSVPDQQAFPFVTIGGDTGVDWSTITDVGMDVTLVIHTWSRAEGRKEAKTIMARVHDILHRSKPSLGGTANLVNLLFEFGDTILDPDGVTYHGVQRFRALTQGG